MEDVKSCSRYLILAKKEVRRGTSMHGQASLGNGMLKFGVMWPQRYQIEAEIKFYNLVMSNYAKAS